MGGEGVYRAANRLGLGVLRALDAHVRVTGAEHIPAQGAAVLASTHISYLDFLVVEYAARTRGRYVRFLCRHDIWKHRPVAWAMDQMRHVPVDRTVPAYTYLRARSLLGEGELVAAFPEAGIGHSFVVRSLMPGAAALALETGLPLLPVAVWGTQRVTTLDRNPLRRHGVVDVHVGEPLDLSTASDARDGTRLLGQRLQELSSRLQAQSDHRPPSGAYAWWHPRHLGGHAPDLESALRRNPVPRSAVPPTAWTPEHGQPS